MHKYLLGTWSIGDSKQQSLLGTRSPEPCGDLILRITSHEIPKSGTALSFKAGFVGVQGLVFASEFYRRFFLKQEPSPPPPIWSVP